MNSFVQAASSSKRRSTRLFLSLSLSLWSLWRWSRQTDGRSVGLLHHPLHMNISDLLWWERMWWRRGAGGFYLARAGSNYSLSRLFFLILFSSASVSLCRWSSWCFVDVWCLDSHWNGLLCFSRSGLWCVHQNTLTCSVARRSHLQQLHSRRCAPSLWCACSPESRFINSFVLWIDNVTSVLYCPGQSGIWSLLFLLGCERSIWQQYYLNNLSMKLIMIFNNSFNNSIIIIINIKYK